MLTDVQMARLIKLEKRDFGAGENGLVRRAMADGALRLAMALLDGEGRDEAFDAFLAMLEEHSYQTQEDTSCGVCGDGQ